MGRRDVEVKTSVFEDDGSVAGKCSIDKMYSAWRGESISPSPGLSLPIVKERGAVFEGDPSEFASLRVSGGRDSPGAIFNMSVADGDEVSPTTAFFKVSSASVLCERVSMLIVFESSTIEEGDMTANHIVITSTMLVTSGGMMKLG
jgi:hypothetical protein